MRLFLTHLPNKHFENKQVFLFIDTLDNLKFVVKFINFSFL